MEIPSTVFQAAWEAGLFPAGVVPQIRVWPAPYGADPQRHSHVFTGDEIILLDLIAEADRAGGRYEFSLAEFASSVGWLPSPTMMKDKLKRWRQGPHGDLFTFKMLPEGRAVITLPGCPQEPSAAAPAAPAKGNGHDPAPAVDVAAAVRQRLAVVLPKRDAPVVARRPDWMSHLTNKRLAELRRLRSQWREHGHSTAALDRAKKNGDDRAFNPWKLGAVLQFTFADYKAMGEAGRHPSTIRPCDATEDQVEAYLKQLRKPARAARAREKRAGVQEARSAAAEIGSRSDAIRKMLAGDGKTVSTLMADLAYCKAFNRLTGHSLRVAILRELEKPALAALIAIDRERGKYGQDKMRVRLK
jgi:hypothetical protein